MLRLTKKAWLLTVAVCLLATLGAYVSVAANHLSEDVKTELVELEECIAVAERVSNRSSKRPRMYNRVAKKALITDPRFNSFQPFLSFRTERDRMNGLGGYLRT